MTNALAQQYNWIGTATKQSFGRLQRREVICGMSCLITISTNIGSFSALTLLVELEGHLACKKVLPQQCSWLTVIASKSGKVLSSQEGCFFEAGGRGRLTFLGSMVSLVRNSVILQCFDAVGCLTSRASSL